MHSDGATPPPSTSPLPTTVACPPGVPWGIGACLQDRYELRGHLGRGGFGEVYSAFDRVTEREVAIKALLRPGAGATRFPRAS